MPHPDEPAEPPASRPTVTPGGIRRALLDEHALTVVRRLRQFEHDAYFVGGCVRDLLSGLEPKDFDVVTDARPNRIRRLFRNARIIGRRFRLAHIRFGPDHVIETSTYRAAPARTESAAMRDGRENVFGTAAEDARRRDFTINALFYDPLTDEVLDWVGGLADLEARVVRSIGDPAQRIVEDPVRMIRAVHFAERMGFVLEPSLDEAIRASAAELDNASPARLYVELIKILNRSKARPTLRRLHEMGVLAHWLPELDRELAGTLQWPDATAATADEAGCGEPEDLPTAQATWNLLGAADRWGMASHHAEDALALAPLLGPWLLRRSVMPNRRLSYASFAERLEDTLRPMARRMSVPRRTSAHLRDLLWLWMQVRRAPGGKRPPRLVHQPGFRLALDYLRLDLMSRDCPLDLVERWSRLAPRRRPEQGRGQESRRRRRRGSRGRRERRRRSRRRELRPEASAWLPAPHPEQGPERPPATS